MLLPPPPPQALTIAIKNIKGRVLKVINHLSSSRAPPTVLFTTKSLTANKNAPEKLQAHDFRLYEKDCKKFNSVSKLITVIAECFLKRKAKGQEYA